MGGAVFDVEFTGKESLREVVITAEVLFERLETVGVAMQEVARFLGDVVAENFNAQAELTTGIVWAPLADTTQEARRELGYGPAGPKLRRTDNLLFAVLGEFEQLYHRIGAGSRTFFLNIDVPAPDDGSNYAADMQWGTEKNGNTIPARPFVPVGQRMTGAMKSIVEGYLDAGTARASKGATFTAYNRLVDAGAI